MRPLKLNMQAFGPYADLVTVDFTLLKESGLYLISGDTGAGKTTIFDGICYALFDQTSGSNRSPEQLRSLYAKEGVETKVELWFSYDEKEYRIMRSPAYEYTNRNGKSTIKQPKAELTLPDGSVLSAKRQVDAKIKEIIHLDYEQFRRIVMLAQGDFLQLLYDAKGRGEILRKIFDTSFYQEIRQKIFDDSKLLEQRLSLSHQKIRQYLDMTSYETGSELEAELDDLKENEDALTSSLEEVLKKIVTNDKEELTKTEEEIAQKDALLLEKNNLLGLLEKKKSELTEYEKGISELPQLKIKAEELQKTYDAAVLRKPEITALLQELALLKEEEPKYAELSKLLAEERDAEKRHTSLSNALEKEKNRLDQQSKEAEECRKDLESLQKTETLTHEKNLELLSVKEQEKNVQELIVLSRVLEQNEKNYLQQMELYKRKREVSQKESARYQMHHQLFLDSQAGILAEGLLEGEPCPVCGSLHHPNKAQKAKQVISEAELKQEELSANKAEKEMQDAATEASRRKGVYESSQKEYQREYAEYFQKEAGTQKDPVLVKEASLLREKRAKLEKENADLIAEKKRLEESKEKAAVLDAAIEKTQKEILILTAGKAQAEANHKALQDAGVKLRSSLRFESREALLSAQREKEAQKGELESAIGKAEEELRITQQEVSDLNSRLAVLKENLAKYPEAKEEELRAETDALKEKRQLLRDRQVTLSSRIDKNGEALQQIRNTAKEIGELEERSRYLKAISDTCGGKVKGKDKIDFETYVQMTYFDRILAYANRRFEIMTDSQYTFKRAAAGLGLNVIDHVNGSERAVETLSGGESFKASLSLALGLSDEVMSRTASVHIDTMFVDEGFGSLDEDSLNKAMEALSVLSEGNRLVGIISHVKELQQRIDQQILVHKDEEGISHIEIIH